MEQTLKSTPKDVFLHLFNIVTFYLSVIGFITLYVQYINASFPDELNYYFTSIANGVRWSTSILFVAVPAYLFTSWLLAKDLNITPEKRELKLRKWLVYFTLFISAITIIVDLMIFVYNFLDGELNTRFFLKVLVVLLVAVAVFAYYMWDLKRKEMKSKIPKILAIVLSVIVLVSIIIGFFIASPIGFATAQWLIQMLRPRSNFVENHLINKNSPFPIDGTTNNFLAKHFREKGTKRGELQTALLSIREKVSELPISEHSVRNTKLVLSQFNNLRPMFSHDQYDVIEDADLGSKLRRWGLRVQMFDEFASETYEGGLPEISPPWNSPWVYQRSRWISMAPFAKLLKYPADFGMYIGSFIGMGIFGAS